MPDGDYWIDCKEKADLANMNIVYQEQDEITKENRALDQALDEKRKEIRVLDQSIKVYQALDEIRKHDMEQRKERANMDIVYQEIYETNMNIFYQGLYEIMENHHGLSTMVEINRALYQALDEIRKHDEEQRNERTNMNIVEQDKTRIIIFFQALKEIRKNNMDKSASMNTISQAVDEFKKDTKQRDDSTDTHGELGMINDSKTVRKLYLWGKILESFTG